MDATTDRSEVYHGLQVERRAAPIGRRIISYVIDLGIVYAAIYLGMVLVMMFAFGIIGGGAVLESFVSTFSEGGNSVSFIRKFGMIVVAVVMILFVFGVYHGYFVYFEYKKGATPGKRFFGLSVVSTEGGKLSVGQCVLRDILRYIDCMLIFPGLVSIAATQRKQRLGDLAAGTLVVYSARKEQRREFVYITQDEYQYLVEVLKPLAVEEVNCNKFLAFAYPRFVKGQFTAGYEDLEKEWETFAHHYLPEAKARELDRQTTLLFFAEHCCQTVNLSNGG